MARGWPKGVPRSEETKKKMSDAAKRNGNKNNTPKQHEVARKTGIANRGRTHSPEARAHMGRKRQPDSGYGAAHKRVRYWRGPASEHTCACGNLAIHWAFTWRTTPPDRWMCNSRRQMYSLNEEDYEAMCGICASWYDKDERVRAFVFST